MREIAWLFSHTGHIVRGIRKIKSVSSVEMMCWSHSCGLFDAVEADPGRGRGDGHGSCHSHSKGVVVLPAVPPFPYCRTYLKC